MLTRKATSILAVGILFLAGVAWAIAAEFSQGRSESLGDRLTEELPPADPGEASLGPWSTAESVKALLDSSTVVGFGTVRNPQFIATTSYGAVSGTRAEGAVHFQFEVERLIKGSIADGRTVDANKYAELSNARVESPSWNPALEDGHRYLLFLRPDGGGAFGRLSVHPA